VYSTGTNTIAIWGSDWDLRVGGDSSTVHILNQTRDQEGYQDIDGINANAFHVLYSAVHKYEQGSSRSSSSEPSTFSLSIYEDSSIRLRYHSLLSKRTSSDVFGLWGSRVSNHNSEGGSRDHEETISEQYLQSGNDITLCYLSTVVCSRHAIASAGQVVNLTITGKSPSCLALGENLITRCVWLGQGSGYESTPSFHVMDSRATISCPVPNLDLEDDSLVSLDLSYGSSTSSLVSSLQTAQHSLITKFYDPLSGQLSSAHAMVRYFNTSSSSNDHRYGCNPLFPGTQTCDVCGVCGGMNTSVDCHGDCFGVAYIDTCGVCAGGSTGIYPDSTCDLSDPLTKWENGDVLDTLSKTILLLTMMICMTFIFSACMRIIRASFVGPEDDRPDGFFGIALQHMPTTRREMNGLNSFEIDSLGQIVFVSGDLKGGSLDPDRCDDIESSPSSCILTLPLQPNLECSICLIEFNEDDHCRQLPCDHIFHSQCIDQWFTVSVVCPMCKRNIRAILHGDDDVVVRQPPAARPSQPSASPPPSHHHHPQQQSQHDNNQTSSSRPVDYLTTMSPMIEMTDTSMNSSSFNPRVQGEQEAESTSLINPFT
jgi:hypothetical protein